MKNFFKALVPFLLLGIAIVAFAFGILLFAYLFLFGAIIGTILFIINAIHAKFFPAKKAIVPPKKSGRIIETNHWNNRE